MCVFWSSTVYFSLLPLILTLTLVSLFFVYCSQAVLLAEKDGAYSHTGIVVDSAGVLMIVHAVPGEPDFEGDEDRDTDR